MDAEKRLVSLLRECDLVQRTKAWKRLVESHPAYACRYAELLELQKEMVRGDQSGNPEKFRRAKALYEAGMAELTAFPAVAEYLTCAEELQELVDELQDIVQLGLNQ